MSVRVVGAGVAAGLTASGLGTGAAGSGCYIAGAAGVNGGQVDTGLQQVTVQFGCVDGANCQYLYDIRATCSAPVVNFVRQVCFQAYNNASCGVPMGPKQCSPENKCTHVSMEGADESTLQVCQSGYVHIDLYRNTSSCRAEKKVYGYNTTIGVCAQVAPQYYGILTCGELLIVGGWVFVLWVGGWSWAQ